MKINAIEMQGFNRRGDRIGAVGEVQDAILYNLTVPNTSINVWNEMDFS